MSPDLDRLEHARVLELILDKFVLEEAAALLAVGTNAAHEVRLRVQQLRHQVRQRVLIIFKTQAFKFDRLLLFSCRFSHLERARDGSGCIRVCRVFKTGSCAVMNQERHEIEYIFTE